jgi:hypothetical protein
MLRFSKDGRFHTRSTVSEMDFGKWKNGVASEFGGYIEEVKAVIIWILLNLEHLLLLEEHCFGLLEDRIRLYIHHIYFHHPLIFLSFLLLNYIPFSFNSRI